MAENGHMVNGLSPKKHPNQPLITKTHNESQDCENYEDFTCPICLYLLIEPVVLPCEHEFCKTCFTQNVQEANLQCPLCRVRISSWARKHARSGTLVHKERWELIQKLFPKRCEKRIRGEEDLDTEESHPSLKRILSENGAIRKEYEQEIGKIRHIQEAEQRASEELICRLIKENDSVAQQREQQRIRDEELARQLQHESNIPAKPSSANHKIQNNAKLNLKHKTNNKRPLSTLDKWFSPKQKSKITVPEEQRAKGISMNGLTSGENTRTETFKPTHRRGTRSEMFADIDPSYAAEIKRRKEQEEADFKFALQLQQKLDTQAKAGQKVDRKKGTVDGYLLRNCPSETPCTSDSSNTDSGS